LICDAVVDFYDARVEIHDAVGEIDDAGIRSTTPRGCLPMACR
jgi:hypothetical protein